MPISVPGEVGHNENATTTTSIIVTLTAGIAVGHMGVAGIVNASPAQSVSSITDSKGNTWTVRSSGAGGNARGTVAESIIGTALLAGDTVTINFTGNTASQLASIADSSSQAVSPHDQAGSNSAAGTTAFTAATAGATGQADEAAFVVYGYGTSALGSPFSSNGGYTPIADRFGTNRGIWFGYRILSATGVETAAQTAAASESYGGAIDTYKAAAATSVPVRSLRVGRSRAALRARLRRRPALLRGRSVTTPTPLVRQRVYAKRHRRGAVAARRKHRNVVYSRPPARFTPLVFFRPAILVVRHARQALLARRKHDRAVVLRSPQAPPRPRPPIVVSRRQPRLVARRKHRTVTPAVRPPAVSLFRRAAQIIVRKARAPLDARRKHRAALLTRPRVEQPPPRRPAPPLHRGRVRRLIRRLPHLIRPTSRPAAAPAQPVAVHAELGDRHATDATTTDTLAAVARLADSPTVAADIDAAPATEATTRDTPTPDATTDDGP